MYSIIDVNTVTMKFKFVNFFTSSLLVDSNNKYKEVNIVINVIEFEFTIIVDNVIYLKDSNNDRMLDVINIIINPFFPNNFLDKYTDATQIIRIQR